LLAAWVGGGCLRGFCAAKSCTTGELQISSPRIGSALLGTSLIAPVVVARLDDEGLCDVELCDSTAVSKLSVGELGVAECLEKAEMAAFLRSIRPRTAERDLERFLSCFKEPSVVDVCDNGGRLDFSPRVGLMSAVLLMLSPVGGVAVDGTLSVET
jgi:hypothetical protein